MWEIIRKNKIKSVIAFILVCVSFSFIHCLIYGFVLGFLIVNRIYDIFNISVDYYYLMLPLSIGTGCILPLLICLTIFWVKSLNPYQIYGYEMYKTNPKKHKQLYNIAEEMAIASGLKKIPDIYILNSDIVNIYSCGISPEKASIVISKGMLEILSREELQGVIAHEIGHIVNRDTSYILCCGIISGLFEIANTGNSIGFHHENPLGKFIVNSLNKIGYHITSKLLKLISKEREYIADACACQYTRYPKSLADALMTIEHKDSYIFYDTNDFDMIIKASFIIPVRGHFNALTHPNTKNRIRILLNMQTADYIAYEKEFQKINHKKLLPESALKNIKPVEVKIIEENKINLAVMSACTLNNKIMSREDVKIIKENKNIIDENIQKHREVEDLIRELSGYSVINCECGTKLKIPPVYKNKIVICPHCGRKHNV